MSAWKSLLDTIRNATTVSRRWLKNQSLNSVSAKLETAIDELIDLYRHPDEPYGDLGPLGEALALAEVHWKRWRKGAASDKESCPSLEFWTAMANVEAMAETMALPSLSPMESIEELFKTQEKSPSLSDRQICLMYNFLDHRGQPDFDKLEDEKKNPGKHSSKFIDPAKQRREETVKALLTRAEEIPRAAAIKVKVNQPAEEPIEQLAAQGVSAFQIAKMHHCTIAEVFQACDVAGVARPVESYGVASSQRSIYEKSEPEEMAAAYKARMERPTDPRFIDSQPNIEAAKELAAKVAAGGTSNHTGRNGAGNTNGDLSAAASTIDDQVAYYHQQGMRPGAIARELGISGQDVRAILFAREKAGVIEAAAKLPAMPPIKTAEPIDV